MSTSHDLDIKSSEKGNNSQDSSDNYAFYYKNYTISYVVLSFLMVVMSSIISLSILLVNYLLLKSHTYAQGISYINLDFYYEEGLSDVKEFKTRGLLISKQHLENIYILSGDLRDKSTFYISNVTYKSSFNPMCDTCFTKIGRSN